MAWELIGQMFPLGEEFQDIGFMTKEDLENTNLEMVTWIDTVRARDMITHARTHAVSKDNLYMIGEDYNVYKDTFHPDPLHYPLNVYGAAMVNNYNTYYAGGLK